MPSKDFPNAPEMGDIFRGANRSQRSDQAPNLEESLPDDLDHHDLATWDYTPGGYAGIEQEVHTELSDAARREFQQRMQREMGPGDAFRDQVDAQFERAVDRQEAERVHQEIADEQRQRQEAEAERQWHDEQLRAADAPQQDHPDQADSSRDYDMPDAGRDWDLTKDPEAASEYEKFLAENAEREHAEWTGQDGPNNDIKADRFDGHDQGGGHEH